ncbi:hypothetical protein [Aureimonas sp. AU20]|uniref:hypothetical protein n=1 Tax=Aureimonas sp. AU20 TaxID=1349819 RepID=UPI0007212E7D|nr:hypothetical protein [Aureimonas sp. AU20]ALN71394.1 hypothetical protein M673_01645 [Aureimonas sp. AU20]
MARETGSSASPGRQARRVALYGAATIIFICLITLPQARDYVGADNDDAMRLVEVRDFLAGQGWFDLMQYRLGLPPGVLMHWSRLVDAPIAALIRAFATLFDRERAEALALAAWPLSLTLPVLAAFGSAGQALGGRVASHVALILSSIYLATSNRFLPGAIDHHNVQLALVAVMTAVLVTRPGWRGYALAGAAAGAALAVGAETTPLVAAVCGLVAVTWALEGRAFQGRCVAFSLGLALGVTALFFATIPPARYWVVTCDALSFGFYALAVAGGGFLGLAGLLASGRGRVARFACLAAIGALTGALAVRIAPDCLGNPLAGLDPMLVTLWLDKVSEARSIAALARTEPNLLGSLYAPGLFALAACAFALWRGERVRAHAVLAVLLLVSLGVAIVQVRGAMFSNLLAIVPLSLLLADLRARHLAAKGRLAPALAFGLAALCAPSAPWAVAGYVLLKKPAKLEAAVDSRQENAADQASPNCYGAAAMAPLAALEPTTVAADVDAGTWILRFTPHRVLAAPYHRNQAGMLAELRIALAPPAEAEALLRKADVGVIALCEADGPRGAFKGPYENGLFARLAAGDVPPYLEPLPFADGLRLYRVRPAS